MILNSRLRDHWKMQGISPYGGISAAEITAFERMHDVAIPPDLRDFLLEFNGTTDMGRHDYFRFLRLEEFTTSDRNPTMSFGQAFHTSYPQVPNGFFVFADYLQWCYGYAIQLSKGAARNVVVLIGGLTAPLVADSFTEFMNLYLQDSTDIHPSITATDPSM